MKAVLANSPPFSPAFKTDAQAVPSGYGSVPCSFTINAFLNGIIINVPSNPPKMASIRIVK